MNRVLYIAASGLVVASLAGMLFAQRGGRGGGGMGGGGRFRGGALTDLSVNRNGIPMWEVDKNFKSDVFTFVRIQYTTVGGRGGWLIDYPDSDLNFPFRLQQLTSLKVDPVPINMTLTNPDLFKYPFIYMLEVGGLYFFDDEIEALRRYLTNGGFLMVDDFWGESAWARFYSQMKRVLPNIEPVELDISHPIFHCVFDLKELPQVPAIGVFENGRVTEISPWDGDGDGKPHYYAWFDAKGHMMAIACNNTDLGDGWEREGQNVRYFEEMSVKKAYPMGVNIVFYAMTH